MNSDDREKSAVKDMDHTKLGMTNFDKSIDLGFEAALRQRPGEVCGQYAAAHFCGWVWFEDDMFHCEVWVYNQIKETISADSLKLIMTKVSNRYGWE